MQLWKNAAFLHLHTLVKVINQINYSKLFWAEPNFITHLSSTSIRCDFFFFFGNYLFFKKHISVLKNGSACSWLMHFCQQRGIILFGPLFKFNMKMPWVRARCVQKGHMAIYCAKGSCCSAKWGWISFLIFSNAQEGRDISKAENYNGHYISIRNLNKIETCRSRHPCVLTKKIRKSRFSPNYGN